MTRPPIAMLWVWAAIVIPSWSPVYKYLQAPGVVAYSVAVALVLWFGAQPIAAVARRGGRALAVTIWLAATVLFLWAYPLVNAQSGFTGSDDDDAHNVGVAALVAGESPYSRQTYLGNEMHQLPGSMVLALPFALVWTSALQNLFWLPLFFVTAAREARDETTSLAVACLVFGLSPAVLSELVTGSSLSANTIAVLLGLWWVTRAPRSVAAAMAWGVALCTRPNFLFLMPLAFGWLARECGWRAAARAVAIAGASAAALVLPFYLENPEFAPWMGFQRLHQFNQVVDNAGLWIAAAMGALACGLACVRVDRAGLFRHCALVQVFPVAVSLVLSYGLTDVSPMAAYGSFASWFALMGAMVAVEPWLAGVALPRGSTHSFRPNVSA